jgi:hypothetical protein
MLLAQQTTSTPSHFPPGALLLPLVAASQKAHASAITLDTQHAKPHVDLTAHLLLIASITNGPIHLLALLE